MRWPRIIYKRRTSGLCPQSPFLRLCLKGWWALVINEMCFLRICESALEGSFPSVCVVLSDGCLEVEGHDSFFLEMVFDF
ncbi:hypothetical protein CEXT_687931 [Caerostris extrusa]|uniref:Uncharacterized protein n=1 Tax=Caerostris extrusa TaxID=172846 RepID=A0AAV4S5V3_CAEEX|nr:hypothetical protein CEXT_687931 [Caerostris extrusa]